MSIPTVYINGTKKEANAKLAEGKAISCLQFGLNGCRARELTGLPDGTVIKFFKKWIGENPYATSYGNWKPSKNKIV